MINRETDDTNVGVKECEVPLIKRESLARAQDLLDFVFVTLRDRAPSDDVARIVATLKVPWPSSGTLSGWGRECARGRPPNVARLAPAAPVEAHEVRAGGGDARPRAEVPEVRVSEKCRLGYVTARGFCSR